MYYIEVIKNNKVIHSQYTDDVEWIKSMFSDANKFKIQRIT